MGRRNAIFAVLAVTAAIAAGCQPAAQQPATSPFVGGTSGILIDFLEGSPPKEVTDGGEFPFDIIVNLKNDGETDVPPEKVEVKVSGIFPEDFNATSDYFVKRPSENLSGVKKDSEGNRIPGSSTQIEFTNLNYLEKLPGGSQSFPLRVDVCYNYGTEASSLYCMRKNLVSSDPGVCVVSEEKSISNSGSPIQVVSFKESVSGSSKVLFTFKVALRGNGEVFKRSTNCATGPGNEDRVYASVDSGLSGIRCSGLLERTGDAAGYLRLENREATFSCVQEVPKTDAVKPITLTLDFDYLDQKSTDIVVKHLLD